MAGSPKKRARREAARNEREAQPATGYNPPDKPAVGECPSASGRDPNKSPGLELRSVEQPPATIQALEGEILPPSAAPDPTRTALKRAMRAKAQEFADEALTVLAAAMRNEDMRIAVPAAREILDRAHGKPTTDIEIDGPAGLSITIVKFGVEP